MRRSLTVLAASCALLVAGCGGSKSPSAPAAPNQPAASFPAADGKTLAELAKGVDTGPVMAPTSSSVLPGQSVRFGFGLFSIENKPIDGAAAGLYVAPFGGGPAVGPFSAKAQSLQVAPPFRSRTASTDPGAVRSFYVTDAALPKAGRYQLMALVKQGGKTQATDVQTFDVGDQQGPPKVGEDAIKIHTPTKDQVHGNLASIDTRTPPSDMHDVDFADVLGKKPVLLLFATPLLCKSRVCGPSVDIAEQVKAKLGKQAAFIQMEIYNGNDVNKGYRPQVTAWRLKTEPWAFAIDRHGKIVARFEGAFSPAELQAAVQRAIDVK